MEKFTNSALDYIDAGLDMPEDWIDEQVITASASDDADDSTADLDTLFPAIGDVTDTVMSDAYKLLNLLMKEALDKVTDKFPELKAVGKMGIALIEKDKDYGEKYIYISREIFQDGCQGTSQSNLILKVQENYPELSIPRIQRPPIRSRLECRPEKCSSHNSLKTIQSQ